MNLAAGMAQLGERVALIPWDLRKNAVVGRCLDRNHSGLADCLSGKAELEDIIQTCTLDGGKIHLSLIAAGTGRVSPAELWANKNMEVLLSDLRERFDVILLEIPAAETCSAMLEAAGHTDGILLQVPQNRCDGTRLKWLLEELSFMDAPVLGAVFCSAAAEKRKRKKHRYEK
jgi:Mrp family chromosome partitioning ATPase